MKIDMEYHYHTLVFSQKIFNLACSILVCMWKPVTVGYIIFHNKPCASANKAKSLTKSSLMLTCVHMLKFNKISIVCN